MLKPKRNAIFEDHSHIFSGNKHIKGSITYKIEGRNFVPINNRYKIQGQYMNP